MGSVFRLARATVPVGYHERPVPFDVAKAVNAYLRALPPCTSRVVVVGPSYGDRHYRCHVVAGASSLLMWAERHVQGVGGGDPRRQAAREALPLWLRSADTDKQKVSYVPPFFVDEMRDYAMDFVQKRIARVICCECRQYVSDVTMKHIDRPPEGIYTCWTSEWYCPAGHLLYREDHAIHFELA